MNIGFDIIFKTAWIPYVLAACSLEIEDTLHYLLHCHHFNHIRIDLMNSVKSIYDNFGSLPDKDKKYMLLYGDSRLDRIKNEFILEATLTYIKNSERFYGSPFEYKFNTMNILPPIT